MLTQIDGTATLVADAIPELREDFLPPLIHGAAVLGTFAYHGQSIGQLLSMISESRSSRDAGGTAADLLDRSFAQQLTFGRAVGLELQDEALLASLLFRVRPGPSAEATAGRDLPIRLLAFMAPGDLMVNTPLDFITAFLNIRLDLLYIVPGLDLPAVLPDHDVAICAISDADQVALRRLAILAEKWPRPVLNDPRRIMPMSRDWLERVLRGIPGLHCPATIRVERASLGVIPHSDTALAELLPQGRYPVLLRPLGSHAGHGLVKADCAGDVQSFLDDTPGDSFFLTQFVDYSRGGWFRKYRIAFIDGSPFLCHVAVSERWMVHYLNAGMAKSAWKRAEEAQAMADFSTGFAHRHGAALKSIRDVIALDYFSIDCAETRDGRLLVFEADVAAIIHVMDSPDIFAYKQVPMQHCFDALLDMLRRRSRIHAD